MEVRADRAVVDMAGREDMADKAVWVPIPRERKYIKWIIGHKEASFYSQNMLADNRRLFHLTI